MNVVVMCSATLDGRLAPAGEASSRPFLDAVPDRFRDELARLRGQSGAVAVGNRTIYHDDSSLLPPSGSVERLVVDPEGLLDDSYRVLADDEPTTVVVTGETPATYRERVAALPAKRTLVAGETDVELGTVTERLGERGHDQLLVEGGGGLIYHFLAAELVDELRLLVLPYLVGDEDAVSVADGPGSLFPDVEVSIRRRESVGNCTMLAGEVNYGDGG